MKKAIKVLCIVCFVAALFAMTACSKKQDNLIVGNWKVIYAVSDPENPFVLTMLGGTYTFNADNTCIVNSTYMDMTKVQNGTYTITDDKLTLTLSNEHSTETKVCDIKRLDEKLLTLCVDETVVDFEGNPLAMKLTIDCSRQ
ncbi:MAG: lipocalin family protein [Bacteroidales bacterium]|nr:lipocalin family protein [Bacteroidales bacterium]